MDSQLGSVENMQSSSIAALASVKEVRDEPHGNLGHTLILILMVVFVLLVVGLSVFNFDGLVKIQSAQTKVTNYNSQVQKLAK